MQTASVSSFSSLTKYGEEMDTESKPSQLSSLSWDSDCLEECLV